MVGYIKEPLGTKGYFKAMFEGGALKKLDAQDQIMMPLYKRTFPKWSTVWRADKATDDGGMTEEAGMATD